MSRKRSNRKLFLSGLALAALLTLTVLIGGCGNKPDAKPDIGGAGHNAEDRTPDISAEPKETKEKVTLYFGDNQAMYLIPETREVAKGGRTLEEVIINELIKGPRNPELTRTIPGGTSLISVQVVDGVAYANFSKELQTKHWGGTAGETMTVYSVVNSLAKLEGVKQVQFLLEGKKLETLAGHYDLTGPVAPRWDLVNEK
ncbi:MAG: GerMN domain-containing protein [Bacillota bacterium]